MSSDSNPYQSPAEISAEPPRQKFSSDPLASRGDRFAGSLIDGLLQGWISAALISSVEVNLVLFRFQRGTYSFAYLSFAISLIISIGVFLLLNTYLLSTKGQTIGKLVMGTQIRSERDDLAPISDLILKRYAPTWLAICVPYAGGLYLLLDMLAIFRKNHKCFHDEIAGTKVVKLRS